MTDEIKSRLFAAIGSEIGTAYFYWRAALLAVGPMMRNAQQEFKEHAEEEMDHAGQFAQRLYELGGTPPFDLPGLVAAADCAYPVKPCDENGDELPVAQTTQWLWKEIEKMEKCSVEKYTELAKLTADCDPATNDLVCGILQAEFHHLTDAKQNLVSIGESLESDDCGEPSKEPIGMAGLGL